ncbi:GGDEF domain-containing protein [Alteromonas sp. C1M14]|uniref:GGDEF domain-containing protein n=1 Tax=Alteromonas sp. C1M14 TaxID=2841567 RepID=UPI001C091642|nr:GGDEF domain-containing protein [Alteromonas sp. C1M14]MBU2977879.1 GGDEF domain-containing protein [Alteromonas sp. C1M14]
MEQKNAFLGQLLTTIDLSALGSLYFHQLKQRVSLVHLSLSKAQPHLTYGLAPANCNQQQSFSLPLKGVNEDADPHCVQYTFSGIPSREERLCVGELHLLFAHQFANALAFEHMRKLATKDTLTALGNRNAFNEASSRLHSRAQRYNEGYGIMVIDLDNFKNVNDEFGHQEGDAVLQAVAAQISSVLRTEDQAFRLGGDEFCCLLTCENKDALIKIAKRLKSRVENHTLLARHGISCSIGGSTYRDGDDVESLFCRADDAMYRVKAAGKNDYIAA